jgi:hypothetical protein
MTTLKKLTTVHLYDLTDLLQPSDCDIINGATFDGDTSFALGSRSLSILEVESYSKGQLKTVDGDTYQTRETNSIELSALTRLHSVMVAEGIDIVM